MMRVKEITGHRIFIDKTLGKGSYGTVYKGQNQISKAQCAIKVIDKSSINSDPYLKAALMSEVKIMKMIKSPNVVEFIQVYESPNNYYVIQELCDSDLEHYLNKHNKKIIPEKQAIKHLTEICRGFLVLVKEGILHRDLKPANILMSKGVAKIGDFGFAKKNKEGLANKTTIGTPLYMPLQILKAQSYTSKCDIWGIGCIFYEMLHGCTPWIAENQYKLIHNIQTQHLKVNPSFSKQTKDFLQKALGITEEKRMTWDELFAHPIFNGEFDSQVSGGQTLQNKFKKILTDIRFNVNSQNINLKKFWKNMGYGQDKQLNQKQFGNFLTTIIPNIDKGELHYFFNEMDVNKNKSVSLKQLQYKLEEHGIKLTSQFEDKIPFLLKHIISLDSENGQINNDKHIDLQLQNKVRSCFVRLEASLSKKKLKLYQVFDSFDKDKNGQLNIQEFSKIMSKLDASFTQDDIKLIFEIIDEDKSKTIRFDELNNYYSKINGIPQSLNLPSDYYSKYPTQKRKQ